ncbi:MAG: hypothetical protein ACLU6B_08810 [Lachnospirales bacterium]
MRIASISNNYGRLYDGVGAFARVQNENYPEDVVCVNYTSDCTYEASKAKRFLMMKMTNTMWKCIKDFHKEKFDVVMLEYPFVEWNPLILLPIAVIKKMTRNAGSIFALSLHEYTRVSELRKKVIRAICQVVDIVFVSNEDMKDSISAFSKNVAIRPIPTNLYHKDAMELDIVRLTSNYVFFGLVNHTKAFKEMLDAWDIYNRDGSKVLYILTATPLNSIEQKHRGVEYLYKQDDRTIITLIRSCVCCIVPIKPEVDNKNTTFKTACISGCMCIGKFGKEFDSLPFVINMSDYSIKSFLSAFESVDDMAEKDREEKSRAAVAFGNQFTPQQASKIVYQQLRNYIGG